MTTYTTQVTDLQGNTIRTETFTAISIEELFELQKRKAEEKRKREAELRKAMETHFDPYEILMQIALDA